jgi:hypothetical protein
MAITIPPGVVESARSGTYDLVRCAAESIVELLDGGREYQTRESDHRKELAHLQRAHALLDAIGWDAPHPQRSISPITVNPEHAITLYEALQDGLGTDQHLVDAYRESLQMAERTVQAVSEFMDTLGNAQHG